MKVFYKTWWNNGVWINVRGKVLTGGEFILDGDSKCKRVGETGIPKECPLCDGGVVPDDTPQDWEELENEYEKEKEKLGMVKKVNINGKEVVLRLVAISEITDKERYLSLSSKGGRICIYYFFVWKVEETQILNSEELETLIENFCGSVRWPESGKNVKMRFALEEYKYLEF